MAPLSGLLSVLLVCTDTGVAVTYDDAGYCLHRHPGLGNLDAPERPPAARYRD